MLIEVGAIFSTITRTSTAGSRIFKGARQIWDFKFDVGAAITSKEVDVARCFALGSCVGSRRINWARNNEQHRLPSRLLQHQRRISKSQICRAPLKIRLPAVEVRKNHWLALFQCATSWCLLVWCLWSLTAGGGGLWSMLVVCSAGRCTRGRCGEEECSNFKRLRMMETILDFQVNRKELGKNPI